MVKKKKGLGGGEGKPHKLLLWRRVSANPQTHPKRLGERGSPGTFSQSTLCNVGDRKRVTVSCLFS